MRAFAALAAALGLGAATADAAPARVTFASLPVAELPELELDQRGPAIPAAERDAALSVEVVADPFAGAHGPDRSQANVTSTTSPLACLSATRFDGAAPLASRTHQQAVFTARTRVRAERLVTSGSKAELELSDYWVDARSGGSRLIETRRIALGRVARGPHGFAVWAMRHGDVVELVMPSNATAFTSETGGSFGATSCGHLRASLETPDGGGERFSMRFSPDAPDAAAFRMPSDPDSLEALRASQRVPKRVRVHASLSRSHRDRQPVLSVVVTAGR